MQNNKDRVSCKITKIACQAIHQVLLQGVRKIQIQIQIRFIYRIFYFLFPLFIAFYFLVFILFKC